jgi:hypothetical protein
MVAKALNTLGLILNISGSTIIFLFFFPQLHTKKASDCVSRMPPVLPDRRTVAGHAKVVQTLRSRICSGRSSL